MRFPIYLTKAQAKELEYEILSNEFLIYVTRLLLEWSERPNSYEGDDKGVLVLMRKNTIINLSRTISGGQIYVLTSDDWGLFMSVDHAWHDGTFLIVVRELSTIQFIEFACELLNQEVLQLNDLNSALTIENSSFHFNISNKKYGIELSHLQENSSAESLHTHPNVRTLVKRMDNSYQSNDYSAVLHASASIFETLAKDIIGIESIKDSSLGSIFDRYRKDSGLPAEILDYILSLYKNRNSTPLAGHGHLDPPTITPKEALIITELTKSFVKIEYSLLKIPKLDIK